MSCSFPGVSSDTVNCIFWQAPLEIKRFPFGVSLWTQSTSLWWLICFVLLCVIRKLQMSFICSCSMSMRLSLGIFGFVFGGFPCATGLVKGLDCVSVLLEPPRGFSCPPSLSRGRPLQQPDTLAHFTASLTTAWWLPQLLPNFCGCTLKRRKTVRTCPVYWISCFYLIYTDRPVC